MTPTPQGSICVPLWLVAVTLASGFCRVVESVHSGAKPGFLHVQETLS